MTIHRKESRPHSAPPKRLSRSLTHLPASVHGAGHFAGLHPEDQPASSGALHALRVSPAPAVAPVEQQGKLVLTPARRPAPVHTPWLPPPAQTQHPRPSLGQLATIGYCQPGAEAVIAVLVRSERFLLVDIRLTPWSYSPQWQGRALSAAFGIQYLHLPELGNENEDDATLPPCLANSQVGLEHLLAWLDGGRSCLLLCGCPDFQRCHRALVAALLQQARPALRLWHLVCDLAAARSVEVQATSRGTMGVSLDLTLSHAPLGEEEQPRPTSILVTPLALSVRVPGRGCSRRTLDFVSWPQGGKPGRPEPPPAGAWGESPGAGAPACRIAPQERREP